jgi:ribulose-5-phosphate 4-epimerase/fuculose-1-phosphate aldolase
VKGQDSAELRAELRAEVVALGASLFDHGLTAGRTGNLRVRVSQGFLVTLTGASLGRLTPDELSLVDLQNCHLDGPRPSKEAFLHAAVYRARPQDSAVVHTHSTHTVTVSCLADVDPQDVLPPLTAYYVMRVGRLPLVPYHAPGDQSRDELAERTAARHAARQPRASRLRRRPRVRRRRRRRARGDRAPAPAAARPSNPAADT